jgi:dienelactone hydrolase
MMRRSICLAAILATAQGGAAQTDVPRLPDPSGPFGIGRTSFHWTDPTRPESFVANRAAMRELMVYVWYPTAAHDKFDAGAYVPGARQIDAAGGPDPTRPARLWPLIVSGTITSHASERAAIAPGPPRFPLVFFVPGDGTSVFAYTTAVEDLVSHGYVVATVEHPFSSSAVVFPDGRVVRFSDRTTLRGDRPSDRPYFDGLHAAMAEMRQSNEIQATDLTFALDQLRRVGESDRAAPFHRRLDFERLGVVGHSLGGMTAVRACQRDVRFKACVNLDGGTVDGIYLQYPDSQPLAQPLMFVEATRMSTFTDASDRQLAERGVTRQEWTKHVDDNTATRARQLSGGRGGTYHVELFAPGMVHGSFTDAVLSATTSDAQQRALHNLTLTTQVTRAFFDKYLKGATATILEGSGTDETRVRRYTP